MHELKGKYDATSLEVEQSVRETMLQERAAEKIRDSAAMQRKVSHPAKNNGLLNSMFVGLLVL